MEKKKYDMKVKSITKTEKEKQGDDTIIYKLVAENKDGTEEITITSAYAFDGVSTLTGVLMITIEDSQTAITDFPEKKRGRKKKEDE